MAAKGKIFICFLIILTAGIADIAVCDVTSKTDQPGKNRLNGSWVSYYQTEIYPANDSTKDGETVKEIVTTVSVINFSDDCFNINFYDGEISEETYRQLGIADFPMAYFGFYKISGDSIYFEIYYQIIDSSPHTGYYCFRLADNELTLYPCDSAEAREGDGPFWNSPGDPAFRRPIFFKSGTFLRQMD